MTTLLMAGRGRTQRGAASLGAFWGLGHATTLVACGVPIVLYQSYLPDAVQRGAETVVGFIIISLAVALLVRWRRGLFHAHGPERPAAARRPLQAYGIGLLHGVGGSAGVGLLLLASINSHTYALVGLALFAVFTAVAMTLLTGVFGLTLSTRRHRRLLMRLTPILGAASLSFGVWYSLSALQLAT